MTQTITTFSKDGLDLYGQHMINTWLQHWPVDHVLTVYTEGFQLPTHPRIHQIDLLSVSPELAEFKTQSQHMIDSRPTDIKYQRRVQKTVKWCHKVYAMSHALKHATDNHVVFLDGDTYSKSAVPASFAHDLVGKHLFAVHFENLKHGLHFETGLMVFNMQHQQMPVLLEKITQDYDNLNIYNHDKTWDGYWFSHLYKTMKLDVLDLCQGRGVFNNGLVRDRLGHNAGKEKYIRAGYNKYTATRT
jgi:hypothetical protein